MAHSNDHASASTHHGVSSAALLWTFAALMVLLAITVVVAGINMGPWSIFVAMLIAAIKAALVVLYFMQVKKSSLIIKAYAGAMVVWLLIGVIMTFCDYGSRTPNTTMSMDILSIKTPNQPEHFDPLNQMEATGSEGSGHQH